ncbi:I78 family peptidase inhibitor [Frigidibacter sp. SD6-1]|uniref:I78 family peptidase inhibitor n=1 Tax=Frigidibacter sp. SD6-1 TaxID=3032581 RepID=UPI0024DF8232|nr:I78 family peptidase inhibitor [Frigidibacter sp. SD6-1]
MRVIFAAALLIPMGACMAEEPKRHTDPMPGRADTASCGADGLQHLVGQPESALAAMTFPAGTRFLKPGMAVTMDFSATRLNIAIDGDGLIRAVECG